MASSGPNNPTVAGNNGVAGSPSYSWSNTGNVFSSNNVYATCDGISDGPSPAYTNRLRITGFGFSIPTDATVNGVLAEVELKATAQGNTAVSVVASDYEVKIVKANVAAGNNKATLADITITDTYRSYGGASDTWGTTLTPSDINNSTFGVQWAGQFEEDNESTIYIDHVRITVYYTEAGGGTTDTSSFFFLLGT